MHVTLTLRLFTNRLKRLENKRNVFGISHKCAQLTARIRLVNMSFYFGVFRKNSGHTFSRVRRHQSKVLWRSIGSLKREAPRLHEKEREEGGEGERERGKKKDRARQSGNASFTTLGETSLHSRGIHSFTYDHRYRLVILKIGMQLSSSSSSDYQPAKAIDTRSH